MKKAQTKKVQTKTRGKSTHTKEEFISTWNDSQSLTEISDKLGISKQVASSKAMRYRKEGVELQRFRKTETAPKAAVFNASVAPPAAIESAPDQMSFLEEEHEPTFGEEGDDEELESPFGEDADQLGEEE